tara:strand:+ start:287 stop:1048 length:762 start_codon:yes stop_codon:yes gene_type:complete
VKLINLKKSIKLNPENSTLLIPITIGFIFSILLFSTITLNLSNKKKETNNLLKESETKKLNIDKVEIELNKVSKKLNLAKKNKSDLVSIVGGTKDFDTFLAMINKLSNANFIKILSIKPDKVVKSKPVEDIVPTLNNNQSSLNGPIYPNNGPIYPTPNNLSNSNQNPINSVNALSNNEDLLVPNLEKHIVDIKLEANFEQIVEFFREVELLENIILINDLKISRSKEVFKSIKSPIIIKMEISAHGKSKEFNQ